MQRISRISSQIQPLALKLFIYDRNIRVTLYMYGLPNRLMCDGGDRRTGLLGTSESNNTGTMRFVASSLNSVENSSFTWTCQSWIWILK